MFASERYAYILSQIKNTGAVSTGQLVEALQVSVETVRRDLLQLERQGQLKRVHGGAVSIVPMGSYAPLPQRLERNPEKKARLSALAAGLIREGDVICIDCGSTAVFLAQAIRDRFSRLTVITNSLDVFEALRDKDGFRLILCGGIYDDSEKAFHGHLTQELLGQLHSQKAFLCPSALSLTGGIRDYHPQLLAVQKTMLQTTDRVYILADSNKFEATALLKLSQTDPGYVYVTDPGLPSHLRQLYRDAGLYLITKPEEIRKENIQ